MDELPFYETGEGGQSPDDRFSMEDVNFAKDPINYHLTAYRRYGPIYRVCFRNQTWVAMGGLAANDFAWRNADVWSYQKAMVGFGEELGHVHVTTLDGVTHRRKRRALKPGFRADAVFRHLPVMGAAIAQRLQLSAGREIDLYDFCMRALIFASSRSMVKTELNEDVLGLMSDFEEKFMHGLNLGEFRHEYFSESHYLKTKRTVFGHLEAIVRQREGNGGSECDDNLAALVRERAGEGEAYSFEEKLYDTYLLLIAGAENSTKLIAWIIQYLSRDPAWVDELRTLPGNVVALDRESLRSDSGARIVRFRRASHDPADELVTCHRAGLTMSATVPGREI